ncbi:hypothetical protein F5B22DRAFT_650231 [Xylaria bambusicola]|uniref:uncharacterized protein n=1 Tax=Xylaria bambusicola TaxID=326684 RepID=UPI0020078C93|nr:uncharacterized protein F5B22DRAFT_650231 [Xylaria bambusicola]KAI0506916.1 hypothetical protein F5B22DRAFT_650231 [Xylaria bambusicola]
MAEQMNEEKETANLIHAQSPNGSTNIQSSHNALVHVGQPKADNLPKSSTMADVRMIQTAKRRYMINFRERMERLSNKNGLLYRDTNDALALEASISKRPLDGIVNEYKFLYVMPMFWTHRHEKVLHVVWQPFQQSASLNSPSSRCSRHGAQQKQRQQQLNQLRLRSQRKASQKLILGVRRKPRRRLEWNNRYRPPLAPSQLQVSLSSRRLSPPSPAPSFVLMELDFSTTVSYIFFLGGAHSYRTIVSAQLYLQRLLSGVDEEDCITKLHRVPTLQNFLRLQKENLRINYGKTAYPVLHNVPVYRLNTKVARSGESNGENPARDSWQSEVSETETNRFWRLIHVDETHVAESLTKFYKYGRNFRDHGIVARGMSMREATARYEYLPGDEWFHPHFIPGVFIAMEQRYRRNMWAGQKECEEKPNVQGDTRHGQQKDKSEHKHGGKHPHQHKKKRTNRMKKQKVGTAYKPPTSDLAPTWQILVTDGSNDSKSVHLYTAQVPDFIIAALDKPAQRHCSNTPPQGGKTTTNDEDIRFEFLIRHTSIPHIPYKSFQTRLREAIISSRDSFGALKETRVRR